MSEKKLNDVTSAGAIELEESELGQIAGGLNYSKIEVDYREQAEPAYWLKISDI